MNRNLSYDNSVSNERPIQHELRQEVHRFSNERPLEVHRFSNERPLDVHRYSNERPIIQVNKIKPEVSRYMR